MSGMKAYYISRALISLGFGVLMVLSGSPLWAASLIAALALGWFLLAPHLGRYTVHPEFGVTALRRDERSQMINDKAARNAFVVTMLTLGALSFYSANAALTPLPMAALKWLLILGAAAYYVSEAWIRRTSS